jgi:hypothetical protein
MSLSDLDLRIKNLFPVLRLKSHLTAAGIRKWDGYAPIHLMFVLVTLAFLKITSVHELMKQTVSSFYQARKDTFYRFKNGEWSWRPFYWRFIRHLGSKLKWSRTRSENCFIIDTSVLAKRGKSMEHVSYVYDHTQRKTVNGYELVAFGLITPTNFYPLDFCYRFSDKQRKQARDAAPLNPTGSLVKRIREARTLTKIELAIKMLKEALAKGIVASYVLVDAWFTSPKFFQCVRHLNLHAVGRLKNGKTRYLYKGKWLSLSQLYHAMKDKLIKDPELGCPVATVSVKCRNGVEGIIVFVKGYKEPEAETVAGVKRNPEPKWAAIFSTDPTLSARQVVKSTSCAGPSRSSLKKPNSDSALARSRAAPSPLKSSPQPNRFSDTASWRISSTKNLPTAPSATCSIRSPKRLEPSPSVTVSGDTSPQSYADVSKP